MVPVNVEAGDEVVSIWEPGGMDVEWLRPASAQPASEGRVPQLRRAARAAVKVRSRCNHSGGKSREMLTKFRKKKYIYISTGTFNMPTSYQ